MKSPTPLKCVSRALFAALLSVPGLAVAADVTLSEFGPTTYSTLSAFNTDFRNTSAGVSYDVGDYDGQEDVVRNFNNQGNRVYDSDGSSSGDSTFFDISGGMTFQLDFYIESLGTSATPNVRIAVAAVNAAATHSLVGNYYIQSKDDLAGTATGLLRFEDFNFTGNDVRNSALLPNSSSFSLNRGVWYRLALTFSDYSAGLVDSTVSVFSIDGRGGAITGTAGSLTHSDLNLATYSLGSEVQYGLLPGVNNSGMRLQFDQFAAVPEPNTVALVTAFALVLLVAGRRRIGRSGATN